MYFKFIFIIIVPRKLDKTSIPFPHTAVLNNPFISRNSKFITHWKKIGHPYPMYTPHTINLNSTQFCNVSKLMFTSFFTKYLLWTPADVSYPYTVTNRIRMRLSSVDERRKYFVSDPQETDFRNVCRLGIKCWLIIYRNSFRNCLGKGKTEVWVENILQVVVMK